MSIEEHFKLKKPCANCPFLNNGNAISLREGRLESIIKDLLDNDWSTFQCHKTVHTATGGDWDNGQYMPSGNESMCVGAMSYLMKCGRPTVLMRIAIINKQLNINDLNSISQITINPDIWPNKNT